MVHVRRAIHRWTLLGKRECNPYKNYRPQHRPRHCHHCGGLPELGKDSRFLSSVGYVHKDNLVGKAQFIFFSSDKNVGYFFEFWKWPQSIRFDRFFKKIK